MKALSLVRSHPERQLFLLTAVWFIVVNLVGFGPSYYFRSSPTPLKPYIIIHGISGSAWFILYLVQCILISGRKLKLHQLLGWLAILIAPVLTLSAFYVQTFQSVLQDRPPAATFFSIQGAFYFLVAVILALVWRKKSFIHKRLILFASIWLMGPAVDRVQNVLQLSSEIMYFTWFPLAAMVVFDLVYYRGKKLLSLWLLLGFILYYQLEIYRVFFLGGFHEWFIQLLKDVLITTPG